jgi:sugar phosphate isomerase/epimerase
MNIVKLGMPTLMEFDTIKKNIELAKDLDLDFLELNINMNYCFPTPKCRSELLKFKKDYKIDFTLHYYDTVDISSQNTNYQNYLYKDFEELAINLDGVIDRMIIHIEPGAFMTIHSEKRYVYKYDNSYEKRTIKTLITIREILEKHNISLMLENVPIHPFMENLYKELDNNDFTFCWDIGHDVIYNNRLFSKFKEKYQLKISHMHMHNVDNLKDHQELEKGQLIIPNYIDYALKNDIHVVVEVKDAENLEKSIKYLRTLYN